jgi:hypothetical protein
VSKSEVTIQNPSFSLPFTARPDPALGGPPVGEVTVAHGWMPYYTPQGANDPPWKHRRPEWTRYQQWQKVFGTSATIQGGVYQRVAVSVGDVLTLVVRACFTSNQAGVALRVGIDPFGGTDFRSDEVQWGGWQGESAPAGSPGHWTGGLDNPRDLFVENVEAEAPYVTLFLHIENLYAGKDESAFWDQATFYREGESEPEPEPPDDWVGELLGYLSRIADAVEKIAG